mmetsp:Transcript_3954/g.7914  ORF Transcript_3954/g.7914 Transcript_3954/m.7914 type:complete len:454 (+) Transcript_3954:265-1626(+)
MLTVNPDPSHLWNIRREMLLYLTQTTSLLYDAQRNPIIVEAKAQMEEIPGLETSLNSIDISQELKLTAHCLQRNPKSYSTWYHRKWSLVYFITHSPITFTKEKQEHIGKAKSILQSELELCAQFLQMDERNFHCWNYRRFVVGVLGSLGRLVLYREDDKMSQADLNSLFDGSWMWLGKTENEGEVNEDWMGAQLARGACSAFGMVQISNHGRSNKVEFQVSSSLSQMELQELIDAEWNFTTSKIEDNFSNGSAFHYRSKLLPLVLKFRLAAARERGRDINYEDVCFETLKLAREEWNSIILNAIFTEPDDQTPWWYHRFIVSWAKPQFGSNMNSEDEVREGVAEEYEGLLYDMTDSLRELLEVEKENSVEGGKVKVESQGAKCKWTYLGLHMVLSSLIESKNSLPCENDCKGNDEYKADVSSLRDEAEACLKELRAIDLNRLERYEMLSRVAL